MDHSENKIIVISAPSGTGKTTLNRKLVTEFNHIELSISHTTRAMRVNEKNGDHYWFVSKENFLKAVNKGEMLEWADVFGNLYGTSKKEVSRIREKGHSILLEIDVQGWDQAKAKVPDSLAVFIIPPSIRELWHRLESRGTDDLKTRLKRLQTARKELEHAKQYSHFIVNDTLEEAYLELKGLVAENQPVEKSFDEGVAFCNKLIEEFDHAPWLKEIENAAAENDS